MFTTPSLAETIRATTNRNRFKQQFGLQNQPVDWNQAEQAAGAMQAPREAAPAVAPFAAATQVDPMTGRRGYKPGHGPGIGVGAPGYYGHGLQGQPMPLAYGSAPGITPDQPAQGGGGGGGTGAARNPRGQGADPFDPRSKFDKGKGLFMAEGGEVDGPGGPKDDLVPAMLSDGEYIMPAEAVKFFGLDKLNKMKEKAREGMLEVESGKSKGGSNFQPPASHFPLSPIPHMAEGGPVQYLAHGGAVISNPYADDPALYARRQYQAEQAQPLVDGITDMGGGQKTLSNRYGTGFAAQPGGIGFTGAPGTFNHGGDAMRVTPGQGMAPIPDMIPAGPWSNGALPFDAQANRDNIAFVSKQMERGADVRRMGDEIDRVTGAVMIPRGPAQITVPDARPDFGAGRGKAARGEERYEFGKFMSPSEKDAAARAAMDATLIPGMNRTQSRRFAASPQGVEFLAKQSDKLARTIGQPILEPDGTISKDYYQVNGMNIPFAHDQSRRPDPKLVDALTRAIADTGLDLASREKARRELSDHLGVDVPMPSGQQAPGKQQRGTIQETTQDANGVPSTRSVPVIFNDDGTYTKMREAGSAQPEAGTKPSSRFLQKVK